MIRKMLAAVALASGIALLAPSAAFAGSGYYNGPLAANGGRQCVSADGTAASVNGSSSFVAVDFTVLFRPAGTTGFNQIDSATGVSFSRSYTRARTGTFKFCATDTYYLYSTNVTLSIQTNG